MAEFMLPVSDNEENADQITEENKEIDHNLKVMSYSRVDHLEILG